MQFSAIPAELRARKQWTVWRRSVRATANGATSYSKVPVRAGALQYDASPIDPSHWCTFDEAVACLAANPQVVSGIGYMLTREDPYVVFDVDGEHKAQPHAMGFRQALIDELRGLGTYAETSPSGEGLHVWVRAQSSINGKHVGGQAGNLGIEVYARQFITCTGAAVSPAGCGIADAQALVDRMGLGGTAPVRGEEGDDEERGLNWSDDEALARAYGYTVRFADWWEGRLGCEPGQWSHTFVAAVGVLDRVTGSPAQMLRLLDRAPMVRFAAPAPSGEARTNKVRRTFQDVLARVRGNRRMVAGHEVFGHETYLRITAYARQRAEEEVRRLAEAQRVADIAETQRLADYVAQYENLGQEGELVDGLGKRAASVLDRFADLTWECRKLTPPPGALGELVRLVNNAVLKPRMHYSVPACIGVLAGIAARAYKQDRRGGALNLNFMVLGGTGTGKTSGVEVLEEMVNSVVHQLPVMVEPKSHIVGKAASSVQGIYPELMRNRSCLWYVDEASSQFSKIANPKSASDEGLQNMYNQSFDLGKHSKVYEPPMSAANRQAGFSDIRKLCLSTLWTGTPANVEITTEAVLTGFLSRVIVVRYLGEGSRQVRHPAEPVLTADLRGLVFDLLCRADAADKGYSANSPIEPDFICTVDTSAIDDLEWRCRCICEDVARDALGDKLPAPYLAINRVAQIAVRVACLLAIANNRNAPRVTEQDYKWSLGYVLQNFVALMSSMDSGEVGDREHDDWVTVARALQELRAKARGRASQHGVLRVDVQLRARERKPFNLNKSTRTRDVGNAVDTMVKEGLLAETEVPDGQGGRMRKYLTLTESGLSLLG
jgi:hypothetical protein